MVFTVHSLPQIYRLGKAKVDFLLSAKVYFSLYMSVHISKFMDEKSTRYYPNC